MSKKSTSVPTGMRLPPEMYETLSKSELGISEEVRRRLQRTFYEDQFDGLTRALADDIMELARMVQQMGPPWYANPKAYQALTVAIARWMKIEEPKWRDDIADDSLGPLDPNTWGITLASTYQEVKELQKRRRSPMQELYQRYPYLPEGGDNE